MFNENWFLKHQKRLLWLANTSFGKDILCINGRKSSLSGEKIILILPNSITARIGERKYVTEFRTHNKFSKRIYYAGKPLWEAFHWFDMHLANRLVPALNLGFDTLTVYPDPDPESTSVDGHVRRGDAVNETFSTIRGGAGVASDDNSTANFGPTLVASTTTNQFNTLARTICLFDTSSIPDGNQIDSATLSLMPAVNPQEGLGDVNIDVVSSNPASNTAIVNADYAVANFGSTRFATGVANSTAALDVYTDWTFNATGLANISKTAVTKLGLRQAWDVDNNFTGTWASGAQTDFQPYYADNAGTSKDPKLAVVHSVPAGSYAFFMS